MNTAKNSMKTAVNTTKSALNRATRGYQELGTGSKVLLISIILIIVILIIYWAYTAYQTSIYGTTANPILIPNPVNAYDKTLSQHPFTVPEINSMQFSISVWCYIQNFDYKYGKFKEVLTLGNYAKDIFAPKFVFYERTNAIQLRINTYADINEGCDINNIPIGKWFNLVWVLNGRTVDVYIDGKLERSCTLKGVPRLNSSKLFVCGDAGTGDGQYGFYGQLSKLQFFSSSLDPEDVYNIYTAGPYTSRTYKAPVGGGGSSNGGSKS